jgi:hypothetical protein
VTFYEEGILLEFSKIIGITRSEIFVRYSTNGVKLIRG